MAIGQIVDDTKSIVSAYVPSELSREKTLKVTYYAGANVEVAMATLDKISDVTVSTSVPSFMLQAQGGPLSDKLIQPLQLYEATIKANPEAIVTVLIKSNYSIMGRLMGDLKKRISLL